MNVWILFLHQKAYNFFCRASSLIPHSSSAVLHNSRCPFFFSTSSPSTASRENPAPNTGVRSAFCGTTVTISLFNAREAKHSCQFSLLHSRRLHLAADRRLPGMLRGSLPPKWRFYRSLAPCSDGGFFGTVVFSIGCHQHSAACVSYLVRA